MVGGVQPPLIRIHTSVYHCSFISRVERAISDDEVSMSCNMYLRFVTNAVTMWPLLLRLKVGCLGLAVRLSSEHSLAWSGPVALTLLEMCDRKFDSAPTSPACLGCYCMLQAPAQQLPYIQSTWTQDKHDAGY